MSVETDYPTAASDENLVATDGSEHRTEPLRNWVRRREESRKRRTAMKKLRLDVDSLNVESFDTKKLKKDEEGTVHGHTGQDTCAHTCFYTCGSQMWFVCCA